MANLQRARRMCAAIQKVQYGLVNHAQARAAGLSNATIHQLIATGVWERELRRVYGVAGAPPSWHRDVMAICLSAGEGSAASHRCAAVLWGFDGFSPGRVEISTIKQINAPRRGRSSTALTTFSCGT